MKVLGFKLKGFGKVSTTGFMVEGCYYRVLGLLLRFEVGSRERKNK